jgi:hypothetical protein
MNKSLIKLSKSISKCNMVDQGLLVDERHENIWNVLLNDVPNFCTRDEFINFKDSKIKNKNYIYNLEFIQSKCSYTKPKLENYRKYSNKYTIFLKNLRLLKKISNTDEISIDSNFNHIENIWGFPNGSSISWSTLSNLDYKNTSVIFKEYWETIPLPHDTSIELIKILFWFYRKIIVDNLLSELIKDKEKCEKISAGSVKLTSDYDITIDGDCSVLVAKMFYKNFKEIYGESSDSVFDTNIYYNSFTTKTKPLEKIIDFYDEVNICGTGLIYVLKEDLKYIKHQHVWSIIRLYQALKIPNKLLDELNNITQSGIDVFEKYKNDQKSPFYKINIEHHTTMLSLINFKNPETYYTRGSYMDIVFNQQICKSTHIKYPISKHSLLDSLFENSAFYIEKFENPEKSIKYKKRLLDAAKAISKELYQNLLKCENIDDLENFTLIIKSLAENQLDIDLLNDIRWEVHDQASNILVPSTSLEYESPISLSSRPFLSFSGLTNYPINSYSGSNLGSYTGSN